MILELDTIKYEVSNKKELDRWIFEHTQGLGHLVVGVQGNKYLNLNTQYKDTVTNETIDIIYREIK